MSSGNLKNEIPRWWSRRRLRFNRGLMVSFVVAITLYFFLGKEMTDGFQISMHAVLVRLGYGLGFLVIANIIYAVCAMLDSSLNWGGMERVSHVFWNVVFWCFVAVPFVMPGLILAERYDLYSALGL